MSSGESDEKPTPRSPRTEPGETLPATWQTGMNARTPRATDSRYRIEREVARGGMGIVHQARDPKLERSVALKQLLSEDEDARARFQREVLLTARLQHPAMVPVYEAGQLDDGEPFYAMRMVDGRSLAQVAKDRPLDERLGLLPNLQAVADAVSYAHAQGIIHRDLKPDNILLGEFGETVVTSR